MQIVITGAAGFLGQRLVKALLDRGELTDSSGRLRRIEKVLAFDRSPLSIPPDTRVETLTGDITDPGTPGRLLGRDTSSVFHLAAVVSSQAEEDLELGMRVNFDAARALLERVRLHAPGAKFITTSSVAVFGGELPERVDDTQVWAPQSSYGTQKAMVDLLLSDYSRRGYVDGRILRMPTIVVRPGKPNRAASSFASSIVREPLHGEQSVCPVSPETILWLMSPEKAIANLIHGHELPPAAFSHGRVVNLPGLSISVHEMIQSLRRAAGEPVAQRIRFEPNPAIERIVNSWPGNFSALYARALGFVPDEDFDSIVRRFMQESFAPQVPANERSIQ
jgi:D-erythronate 2-dehydrogenase